MGDACVLQSKVEPTLEVKGKAMKISRKISKMQCYKRKKDASYGARKYEAWELNIWGSKWEGIFEENTDFWIETFFRIRHVAKITINEIYYGNKKIQNQKFNIF